MNKTAPVREWCWKCGERREGSDSYMHRADNPVLAHGRCAVCDDVLLPYPQPSLAEKVSRLAALLSEAYLWTQIVPTEAPADGQDLALSEIAELVAQAQRVHTRELGNLR
jgi:hypothetical protein